MVVYIAGPMEGYEDYNTQAFNRAEKKLKEDGYKVINPSILPKDLPGEIYMPICLAMLRECDYIYMLDNSENSKGARTEFAYAKQTKKLIEAETEDTIEKLEAWYHGR